MSSDFDERLVAAVRATGPNATAEKIHGWLVQDDQAGIPPSLESVKTRLGRLARYGTFRQKPAGDTRGRSYKVYSMFDHAASDGAETKA